MSWKVTAEPAVEPVTLAEAKAHCRVQHDAEDDLITALIVAARNYCEQELDLAIIEQEITLKLDAWPSGRTIYLPRANLLSVTSVSYLDGASAIQTFADFTEDDFSTPARIVNNTSDWPETANKANAITIVYRAGFSELSTGNEHSTPQAVAQALLMLVAHWYSNRQAVNVGSHNTSSEVQMSVSALLHKYRRLGV